MADDREETREGVPAGPYKVHPRYGRHITLEGDSLAIPWTAASKANALDIRNEFNRLHARAVAAEDALRKARGEA